MRTEHEIETLAFKHWAFVEKILDRERQMAKMLYVEAMIHGFKHGREDRENDSS